ncbi:solute carrier family 35 member G1 isoform X2 [Mustelus asterias]
MSVNHRLEEQGEGEEKDNVVVEGSGPDIELHALEKPDGPECNGTTGTRHRAAARKCLYFTCCQSQSVEESAQQGSPPVTSLLVKKIKGIHSLEISWFRCLFQCVLSWPCIIYNELDMLGPKGQRILVWLRGILGASAMMLIFYAIQQMSMADATVILISNPVFVSIFAWIFLKEKCNWLYPIFLVFTLTGVILIARPPFIFGYNISGSGVDYKNRIKGTAAAFGGAICAALTLIVIRKMGKSVNYLISIWSYSLTGLVLCAIAISFANEWKLPNCGLDRAFIILIGVFGMGGQIFLTKALQIEKAGPVALMKTTEVPMAFILQYLFLHYIPTWWSLGGALCVTVSTIGVAIQKWHSATKKIKAHHFVV